MSSPLRLGINIDHVATLRNARGGEHPCPVRAALVCREAGADGLVAHLREDRRHIKDKDIERLMAEVDLPLNLEMAATDEMLAIALKAKPMGVCLVPERREELTTEGGLDVITQEVRLAPYIGKLRDAGMRVSLFVAANEAQIEACARVGANAVELHTGAYAEGMETAGSIRHGAQFAQVLGLEVHAGHGLNYDNVGAVAAIPEIVELNIGHFLMGEAMFVGLREAVRKMREKIVVGS